jgi:hypothetical protein
MFFVFFPGGSLTRQDVALVQDITLASRAAVGALVQQSTNAVPGWGPGRDPSKTGEIL